MSSESSLMENSEPEVTQTDQVFDPPKLDLSGHTLIQEGYYIRDICSPSRPDCYSGAFGIESGKMLVIKDGRYDIVDETRSS